MAERRSLVGNASSAKQTRKAEAYERRKQQQLLADLSDVLATPAGIRIFTTLLERWSAWQDVFSSDALVMAKRAGEQAVAHQVMALAGAARADAVARIMGEHARRQSEINDIAGQSDAGDDTSEDNDA